MKSTLKPSPVSSRVAGFLGVALSVLTAVASDAVIDFRTFIPGVLDAPIYRADGTNRLSGSRYYAELRVGLSKSSVSSWVDSSLVTQFGEGEWAGYLGRDTPVPRVLPGLIKAGDLVWFQLAVVEPYPGPYIPENPPPPRFWGLSEIFSLIVSNTPTPLVGLKSFSLSAAPLSIRRQGDQTVLRWSAGGGLVYYDVETTESVNVPGALRSSGLTPVLEIQHSGLGGWWADWVVTNSISRGTAFYRIRLLTP